MLKLSRFIVPAVLAGFACFSLPMAYADDGVAADGTYTSAAEGRNGALEVKVSIKEGLISNITVWRHHETPVITREAIEDYPKRMAQTGYIGVEAVAGATETCDAIRAAVVDCVRKAGGDPMFYGYKVKE